MAKMRINVASILCLLYLVCQTTHGIRWGFSDMHRNKRDTTGSRVFVVRQTATGELFSVASVPPVDAEQFQFLESAPDSLEMSPKGIVSLSHGRTLNISNITFNVNVTTAGGTPIRSFSVAMFVIKRGMYDPIFSNTPAQLWTTCPVWIRPGTSIFQLQAIDLQYNAVVQYRLESGGEGKFDVDPVSGNVFIVGRQMFPWDKVYTLALSAQIVGMLPSNSTPSQVLSVKVGYLNPQFFFPVFNISFFEDQSGVIYQIQAVSFQNLPLTYSMSSSSSSASGSFTLDSATGKISLVNQLVYLASPHQYLFNVSVLESFSGFTTTTTLTINLLSINHPPFFQVAYYVKANVPEDSPIGTSIMEVKAEDFDPGAFGQLSYSVSDDHFAVVTSSNGNPVFQVAKALDYDYVEGHRYEVTVTATDGGGLNGSTIVRVLMVNVNDQDPVLEPKQQVVIVKEGAQIGTLLMYIQAYDPDGDGITFSCNSCNSPNQALSFSVDQRTGLLTLQTYIVPGQFNTSSYFNLSITLTDDGSCCPPGRPARSSTVSVGVQIQRTNTQPVFSQCRNYNAAVRENLPPNTTVLTMTATDNNYGDDGSLSFSIFGNDKAYFGVRQDPNDPKSAQLYTLVTFNREANQPTALKFNDTMKIPVTVKVQDNGNPSLSTNCVLLVSILDDNDNSPEFDYSTYQTVLTAGAAPSTKVTRVFAIDLDAGENATIIYSIDPSSPDSCKSNFQIDQNIGWITNLKAVAVQSGSIKCTVRATDNGSSRQSTTTTVDISVSSLETEILPDWQNFPGTNQEIDDYNSLYIDENVARNYGVANISATRPSGRTVQYFLTSTGIPMLNGLGTFAFDVSSVGSSLSITKQKEIDASDIWLYYLRCRAYNSPGQDGKASVARLRVNIKDVNDKKPEFLGMDANGNYPASVSIYTRVNDPVIYVTAVDLDREWPNNQVSYSFAQDCVGCANFSIDPTTGLILSRSSAFNPNFVPSYTLSVIATDGATSALKPPQNNFAQVTVYVRVIGGSTTYPKFNQNFTANVVEGSVFNTTVLTAVATYPAGSDTTLDPLMQYGIVSGNDERRFAVDPETGRIYVVGNIFYPQKQSYNLGYRVFDGAVPDTTYISITVVRSRLYPPVFNQTVYTSDRQYVEKDPTSVNKVLAVVAANSPENLQFTYSDASSNIAVDSSSGSVTLAKSLSRDKPDGFSPWLFNVIATDTFGSTGYGLVNLMLLDINDHSPTFDACCLWGSVPENATTGYPVLQLSASDPDNGVNGSVTYSIPSGAAPSPFEVSPTGLIKLSRPLNRANQNNYTITIRATDGGNNQVDQQILILVDDTNDNPPIFVPPKQYSASIAEELTIGTSVLMLTATDADVGINAQLTYSISGQDADSFYVDSIFAAGSGVIKMGKRIDYDASVRKTTYSFTAKVQDPDPTHTDSATVVITVYDINDNAPVFTNPNVRVNISESVAVDTSLVTFTATDIDSGKNANFSFSIDYRNTDPKFNFKIDPKTGQVKIRNPLDRETASHFEVHILATDQGEPPLTGTATLTVDVTDVNDSPPYLKPVQNGLPPFVPANAKIGTTIACFQAADGDNTTGARYTFDYDSVCTSPQCRDFKLETDPNNPNQACLKAARDGYSRDALGASSYNLSIRVSDGSNSAIIPVVLVVEGTTNNPPSNGEKTSTVYNYVGSNGAYGSIPLGNVFVNDKDDWDLPFKTFSLIAPSEPYFALRDFGQIVIYGNATEGQHKAFVKVIDSKSGNKEATGTVTANVKFINDSAVKSAGSMRLSGVDASDLLVGDTTGSKLKKLQEQLATILGTQTQYVDIFSISNVAGETKTVDVMYAAHGSPYYTPERMNALVFAKRPDILQNSGLNVTMAPVDLCRKEFENCWDKGCATVLYIDPAPGLVNTNQTSFVGLNASFSQQCTCPSTSASSANRSATCEAYTCYNSGTCVQNGSTVICICPVGYDGPRCQQTSITFTSDNSYIYLKPLEICETSRLGLELVAPASSSDALVLYNGPMTSADAATVPDFIAIELVSGRPQLRINLGDGELKLPPTMGNTWPTVNDGKLHSLEVFHDGQVIRFVVDHCSTAPYVDNIQNATMDRSGCEASGITSGEKFLLNVAAPLQLGGRSDASYLTTLQRKSFVGCIKHLQHNGQLYDLSVGPIRTSNNAKEGCDLEGCSLCPSNATCVSRLGNMVCSCPPGFNGPQCELQTTIRSFEDKNSYVNWTLASFFSTSVNSTSQLDASLQAMFRTRQENGIILFGESFTTLERNIIEVVNGHLQFRYDLGNGDQNVSLPSVRVNDGVWHTVRVERYGNQVILRLDSGDGIFYNETFPKDGHRVLRLSRLFGAGEVRRNSWSGEVTVKNSLARTCLQDIRFMNYLLPLGPNDEALVASVTTPNAQPDCRSTACGSITCGTGQYCYDIWNDYECRCQDNTTIVSNNVCVLPTSCFVGLCWNGGTCFALNGVVGCICPPGWSGTFCNIPGPNSQASENNKRDSNLIAAIVVPIIVGLLLLLLLILLIAWCVRRRKPEYLLYDPDQDAERENVIAYDEEGAGEEDVQAYDLSRLQKPVDPDFDSIRKPEVGNLTRAAPDPLSNRRHPGDYPSVGDFINDRLKDADNDDIDQDSVRGFDAEGGGSQAGTLSSIESSSSGDQDFEFLNDWGPPFKKLADMYGDQDEEEDDQRDISNV